MFKTLSKSQIIGLLIGLVASLICFFGDFTHGFRHLNVVGQGFPGALFAIALWSLAVIRNVIDYKSMNKFDKLITIVVQLFIFGAFFALFQASKNILDDIFSICVVTFMITMLLFGMRGLCKLSILISLILLFFIRIGRIGDFMGFTGFLVVIMWFISFYLQETIEVDQLKDELELLWGKSSRLIESTASQASDDFSRIGKMVQSATGMPIPSGSTANSIEEDKERAVYISEDCHVIDDNNNNTCNYIKPEYFEKTKPDSHKSFGADSVNNNSDNQNSSATESKMKGCTEHETDYHFRFIDIFLFKGECGRIEYTISFLIGFLGLVISLELFSLLSIPVTIIALIIMLSQGTRRCHDCGINGWLHLIPLFPIYLMIKK